MPQLEMCDDCCGKGEWDDGNAHIVCCWCGGIGKRLPIGYTEAGGSPGDQVTLTMTRDDYNQLLFMMGYATGKATPERHKRWLELVNRINQGNPNFTPYATT